MSCFLKSQLLRLFDYFRIYFYLASTMVDQEGTLEIKQKRSISVTNVNVRESISFLIFRLILIEVLSLPLIFLLIVCFNFACLPNHSLYFPLFVLLSMVKTSISIFVVLKWLFEYYEITPKSIICKKGILYKDREAYPYEHIRGVKIIQGLFGKIFNYGTVELFDWDARKFISLYQIHNPDKYYEMLDSLIPHLDLQSEVFLGSKK